MKRSAALFLAILALCVVASAGPDRYSGKDKEVMQPAPSPCDWYRANEWDISIWGAYAFPANTGNYETLTDSSNLPVEIRDQGNPNDVNQLINTGPTSKDRFLNKDSTWGGGADIKYFWTQYIGFGLEGFALDSRNTAAAGLATVTLRYPIGCSRFAPYVFAGGGVISGGSHTDHFFHERGDENEPLEIFTDDVVNENDVRAIGQFGGGLEIRVTRHIGLIGDFTWNVIDGRDNNFGMVRAGANFAF